MKWISAVKHLNMWKYSDFDWRFGFSIRLVLSDYVINMFELNENAKVTPTSSLSSFPNPPTTMTTERQNPKPFWWLPSSWEVDRDGDKPLLLRFWSRASPTSPTGTMSSTATTGFRENSRRPTDNLYREISAQDFYKVLGARNNRHHNTNEFT